jgi:hypothetical protein
MYKEVIVYYSRKKNLQDIAKVVADIGRIILFSLMAKKKRLSIMAAKQRLQLNIGLSMNVHRDMYQVLVNRNNLKKAVRIQNHN